jgi:hypothetical protein
MPLNAMVKRCWWAGWLVALWAGVAMAQPPATSSAAASAVGRITANTPANPDALTADEFAAIVAEARSVPRNLPPDGHIGLPQTWQTLTRAKLAAMLTMPQFGDLPQDIRPVLIDQAATWDLFDYQRPSDAAELWGRLWSVDVKGRTAWDFFSYIPDPTWSPTSLAMASVFKCFPRDTWTADDPIVQVVTHGGPWQWDMGQGATGMRGCLPEIASDSVHWTPSLIAQVATILVRKFSDQLRQDGCTRHGPDSCLVIFQALFGLDPDNAELPALLKKMEPAFFGNDVSWWESARNDSTPTKIADVMHPRLIQRMAFLTTKLPVVIDHPAAWPAHELENTLAQAFQTSTQLQQLQDLSYTRYNYRNSDRDLINPAHWLTGKRGREAAPALRALASAYAQTHGCALPPIAQDQPITHDGIAAFKRAHAIANIRQNNGRCGELSDLNLPELVTASPARRRQLMAEFRPIANQLAKGGALREDALNQVANACRAKHPAGDPFGLCAEVHANDAAALAAKLAAMPKVDPLACPEDTLANVEQTLSITPAGDDFAACRKDPADTRHAIVALAYHGDAQDASDEDDYDLDVAIVDIDSGDILAHRHDAKGIESDAVSLGRVWLDTARYDLAPGKRAFGVRTENSAHCWQCAFGYTNLSLYLQDGKQLRKLLATTVSETIENDSEDHSTRTALCVGKQRHNGLADIVMSQGASCEKLDGDSRIWRYDGQKYVQAKPAH